MVAMGKFQWLLFKRSWKTNQPIVVGPLP